MRHDCRSKYRYKAVNVSEWLDIECWHRSEKRERDHPGIEVKKGLQLPWKFVKGKERPREAMELWAADLVSKRHRIGKR